jgi:predicted  nucleic acid-binding Zn-ribbon protein
VTLFGVEVVLGVTAVGFVSSYALYQRCRCYHKQLAGLKALSNEATKARLLGLDCKHLQAERIEHFDSVASGIRQQEVLELAATLNAERTVFESKALGITVVIEQASQYQNLFEFEIALLENIIAESSYFSTEPAHKACLQLLSDGGRFDLGQEYYYLQFAEALESKVAGNEGIASSIALRGKLSRVQQHLAQQTQCVSEAKRKIARLAEQRQALEAAHAILHQQYAASQHQVADSLARWQHEQRAHGTTRRRLNTLKSELVALKSLRLALQTQVQKQAQILTQKQATIHDLEGKIADLMQNMRESDEKISKLSAEVAERRRQACEFEARLALLEQSQISETRQLTNHSNQGASRANSSSAISLFYG